MIDREIRSKLVVVAPVLRRTMGEAGGSRSPSAMRKVDRDLRARWEKCRWIATSGRDAKKPMDRDLRARCEKKWRHSRVAYPIALGDRDPPVLTARWHFHFI